MKALTIFTKPSTLILLGYLSTYATVQFFLGLGSGFAPAVNDFIGILRVGQSIDLNKIESLHNGFYPIALPLATAFVTDSHQMMVFGLLSILAGILCLVSIYSVLMLYFGGWNALAVTFLVSIFPIFFNYFASPGPDIIPLGLIAFSLFMYGGLSSERKTATVMTRLFMAGTLIGFAGLFRYHALVVGVGLLVWVLISLNNRLLYLASAASGIILGYSPQLLVNSLGGFGFFETKTPFNVYKNMFPIDWYKTSEINPETFSSVTDLVWNHPSEFFTSYGSAFSEFTLIILLGGFALLLQQNNKANRVVISSLITSLVYASIVSLGYSERGLILLLPFAAIFVGKIVNSLFETSALRASANQKVLAITVVLIPMYIVPSLVDISKSLVREIGYERNRDSIAFAVKSLSKATTASSVVTNDFNLYFTDLKGSAPDSIGGWTNISLNGSIVHNDINIDSVEDFILDAKQRGVKAVVWSPGTGLPGDPDLADLLIGKGEHPGFSYKGVFGTYHLGIFE